jgi:uncharacterized protein YqeY
MIAAMKSGNTIERDVMRLIKGECDTETAKTGKPATDESVAKVVRKLVESNAETLKLMAETAEKEKETGREVTVPERKAILEKETEILSSLLPKTLTILEIQCILTSKIDDIKAAKSDGQATGLAVKFLKETEGTRPGTAVMGSDIATVVKNFRTPSNAAN